MARQSTGVHAALASMAQNLLAFTIVDFWELSETHGLCDI